MSGVTKRAKTGSNEEESEMRRGPWTLEEDSLLIHYIARHGEGRWNMLAKSAGLKRNGKSCRLRWLNYLKPDIKRGNLTPQEQLLILELHSRWGNRWSKIAQHLPGRTDNEIKNYWRTRVQKQARQLNIESGSKKFMEAIRCFWMPRLVQTVEQKQNSPSTTSYSSLTDTNLQVSPETSMLSNYSSVIPSLSPSSSFQPPNLSSTINSINPSNNFPSDSSQFSQFLEPSELPASPCYTFENSVYYSNNPIQENLLGNSTNGYGMEGLNLQDPMSVMGTYDMLQLDYYQPSAADSDWALGNMADTLWNMDAL